MRTEHAHIVLQSSIEKEKTMGKLKSYATRALREHYSELSLRKHFWSRHGSNKIIFRPEQLFPAVHYTIKDITMKKWHCVNDFYFISRAGS